MLTTLLILGVSAVLFVQGRIRSDLVALCSLLCLIMFGILSPEQALSGFSNSIVVMMVGLFGFLRSSLSRSFLPIGLRLDCFLWGLWFLG